MTVNTDYPGFDYAASDVIKFLAVIDFFTIMLKDGRIIHHTPDDADTFRQWLLSHKIKDVRTEKDGSFPECSKPNSFLISQ